ncbi:MAG TPA: hypothetical protein VGF15_06765 [Solirubrobacteraceae bacterium]|jgi:hypothetical protein
MSHRGEPSLPSDVCLLLRAHAEQRWLSREVIPVLRQLETREQLPEEQFGAALAYLEVIWIEAQQRSRETDAAAADMLEPSSEQTLLSGKACRYRQSVKNLRQVVDHRVEAILDPLVAPMRTAVR